MMDRDQNIRQTYNDPNEIDVTDSLNMLLFEKLVSKYGFPNEFNIGLNSNNNYKPALYFFQSTMYRHFSLRNYKSFKEILDREFIKGSIDLYEYTRFISNYNTPKPPYIVRAPFHKIENKYYIEKFPAKNIKKINEVRKIYGLFSFNEQLNCNVYFVKNLQKIRFYIHHDIDAIPEIPKLLKPKFMKALKEINIDNYEISCPE